MREIHSSSLSTVIVPPKSLQGVDLRELKRLMEQLNGQLTVMDDEVPEILDFFAQ